MQNALRIADTALDYFCRAWDELTGLYDRIAMTIMAMVLFANVLYPYYSGPAHLMIPGNVFQTVTMLLSLPFVSLFMFMEANHWDGTAQFIRVTLGFVFLLLLVLLIVADINSVYASMYAHMSYPSTPVPASTPVPQVAVA